MKAAHEKTWFASAHLGLLLLAIIDNLVGRNRRRSLRDVRHDLQIVSGTMRILMQLGPVDPGPPHRVAVTSQALNGQVAASTDGT